MADSASAAKSGGWMMSRRENISFWKAALIRIAAVALGLIVGEAFPVLRDIALILLLGFVAYGLSIYFYVYAQRNLGAAKTSAYYAVAPFIGVLLSLIIFRELPGTLFFIALAIMILGTWLINHGQTESGGSQNEV